MSDMAASSATERDLLLATAVIRESERRLAQFEFRAMIDEILSGLAFDITIAFGPRPRSAAPPPDRSSTTRPPPGVAAISPPLGAITVQTMAAPLGNTAILIRDVPPDVLGAQLVEFLTEHNYQPFIRPLFLCESMAPVPLLSRYGFACLPLQGEDPVVLAQSVAAKFNLIQLRALSDGALIWAAPAP